MTNKKFQVIVADPPWGAFGDKLTMSGVKRGAEANYSTMTTQQICDLPVNKIADPNGALLALWVPSSLLEDGMKVMSAWGFSMRQSYIWCKIKREPLNALYTTAIKSVKQIIKEDKLKSLKFSEIKDFAIDTLSSFAYEDMLSFGMGRLFRQTHEICLIGINNTGIYKQLKNKSQRSVSFAPNLKHSAKPEDLQNSLDKMFPTADGKIEIFARRSRQNWITIGNECPNTFGEDVNISLAKLL